MNRKAATIPENGLEAKSNGYVIASDATTINQLNGGIKRDADLTTNNWAGVRGKCLSARVVTLNRVLLINGNSHARKIPSRIVSNIEVLPVASCALATRNALRYLNSAKSEIISRIP